MEIEQLKIIVQYLSNEHFLIQLNKINYILYNMNLKKFIFENLNSFSYLFPFQISLYETKFVLLSNY